MVLQVPHEQVTTGYYIVHGGGSTKQNQPQRKRDGFQIPES